VAPNSFAIHGGSSSAAAQAFSSQPSNGKNSGGSDFAALLSGTNTSKNTPPPPANDRPLEVQPKNPAPKSDAPSASEHANAAPDQIDDNEEIEATEPTAAPVPPPIDTTQLVALSDALTLLRESLAGGKPVDPELLAQLNNTLSQLANQMGIDLEALTASADLATLLNGVPTDATSAEGYFATLIRSLEGGTSADKLAAQSGETADAIAQINEKLAKLLAAIEGGEVDANKLASLGLAGDKPRPNDVEQSLLRLAKSASDAPAGLVLASPSLKMSEQLLAGKTDDASTAAPTLSEPKLAEASASSSGNDGRESENADDGAPADRRTIAPGPTAKLADVMPASTQTVDVPVAQTTDLKIEAAALRTIPQTYLSSQQQLNIPAIAFEMSRQMEGGMSRFQIRLDPAELGRIDVRLDVDQNGQLNAKLIVERPETLDMMQRDQRALERALQQAGIDAHRATLEFSLKQNDQQANREGSPFDRAEALLESDDTTSEPVPQVTLYRGALQASGLNILA
jgi:flagellar hook-length control protein FliK